MSELKKRRFWSGEREGLSWRGKGLVRWQRRSEMKKRRFWSGERERVSWRGTGCRDW
jgi:hypothetical protein